MILPRVLRERSAHWSLEFESGYKKIGVPTLVVQVAAGLYLAHRILPDISE